MVKQIPLPVMPGRTVKREAFDFTKVSEVPEKVKAYRYYSKGTKQMIKALTIMKTLSDEDAKWLFDRVGKLEKQLNIKINEL